MILSLHHPTPIHGWVALRSGCKKEKVEKFCEDSMRKYPNRVYKIATARSNKPNMIAVYYSNKESE